MNSHISQQSLFVLPRFDDFTGTCLKMFQFNTIAYKGLLKLPVVMHNLFILIKIC